MRSRRLLLAVLLVGVPVLVAVVVGASVWRDGQDEALETADLEATDAVPVASVGDMVALADCTLLGEVETTERGRSVTPGLVSRLVTIRVVEPLVGDCPAGTVVLEEEGWLDDGTEVTVEGWPGSREGDTGVWFLVAGVSDELPYAATVATTGALRWRDGAAVTPSDVSPWVRDAVAGGPEALARQVRTLG